MGPQSMNATRRIAVSLSFAGALLSTLPLTAATHYVGNSQNKYPGPRYNTLCDALFTARDDDTIYVDARSPNGQGTYDELSYISRPAIGTCATRASNLTIRGYEVDTYGRPVITMAPIRPDGKHPQGKGYDFEGAPGSYVVIEDLIFGAQMDNFGTIQGPAHAIFVGPNVSLTVRRCIFHDWPAAIISADGDSADMLMEYNEFYRGGTSFNGGYHNLYIFKARSVTFRYNYVHNAYAGHLFKSRARWHFIYANRFSGEYGIESLTLNRPDIVKKQVDARGTESHEVDMPLGGVAFLTNNIIEQGPKDFPNKQNTGNPIMVAFQSECGPPMNSERDIQDTWKGHYKTATILADRVDGSSTVIKVRTSHGFPAPPFPIRAISMTYVAAPLRPADSVLVVSDASDFAGIRIPFRIRIANEILTVTGMHGKAWKVERAQNGTAVQVHYKNMTVVALDTEEMKVTRIEGNTWTVERGSNGFSSSHQANRYIELHTGTNADWSNELHLTNNTIISDWSFDTRGIVSFGAMEYDRQQGAHCGTNPAVPPVLTNNIIFAPPSQMADGDPVRFNATAWRGISSVQRAEWNYTAREPGTPTSGDVEKYFASPVVTAGDSQESAAYSRGHYDYHLKESAKNAIGRGIDVTGAAADIPCGGYGLPETCGVWHPYEYVHPAGRKERRTSMDIGAHAYVPDYSVVSFEVSAPAAVEGGSTGSVTITLRKPAAQDTLVTCMSSNEAVIWRPDSNWIPAGGSSLKLPFSTRPGVSGAATISCYAAGARGTSGSIVSGGREQNGGGSGERHSVN